MNVVNMRVGKRVQRQWCWEAVAGCFVSHLPVRQNQLGASLCWFQEDTGSSAQSVPSSPAAPRLSSVAALRQPSGAGNHAPRSRAGERGSTGRGRSRREGGKGRAGRGVLPLRLALGAAWSAALLPAAAAAPRPAPPRPSRSRADEAAAAGRRRRRRGGCGRVGGARAGAPAAGK